MRVRDTPRSAWCPPGDLALQRPQGLNVAYERMLKSDVKYRFVIDTKSLA